MKTNVGRMPQTVVCLGVGGLGLLLLSPLLAQKPELRDTLTGHTGIVICLEYSPDGKTLASASQDSTIKLWDVTMGKERATLKGHTLPVGCLVYSPDGKTLASGSVDKTIKLWEVASGKERGTLKGHTDQVMCIAFSPDGKTLASGSVDNTIKLWDVAMSKEGATLKGHTEPEQDVRFTERCAMMVTLPVARIRVWTAPISFRLTGWSGGGFARCT